MTVEAEATTGSRLARIARSAPDALAIVERDASITFEQLDAAASAIARHLVAATAGPEQRVCLLFEDKLPALQAMFGAGRAGVAYAALDAGDPAERLRFIVDDCAPVALLTQSSLVERARTLAPAGCSVIDVTALPVAATAGALPLVDPDALVYLCYTSGSTGSPKGVTQTHRNLLFFADAYAASMRIGTGDRHSLVYTLSFNAANMDVYGALLHGATLCVLDVRRVGIAALADWLDRQRVTLLHTVPTVFRELARRLPKARVLPYLRAVDLGGESVFAKDVDNFIAHTGAHCVLINQLASTEVGLIAQNVIVHGDPRQPGAIVAAGHCPLGVSVAIRRADGSAADIDEVGEMVVASAHVSPGYWRRPALDATVFTKDAGQPTLRSYASGDVGRIDAQGRLHFLGRLGSRVKIRGYSVDLAEVEAALAACDGVVKAAAVAHGDPRQDSQRLCAFVVVADRDRSPQRMRRELASRVPSYMLPSAFAFVDALPLTASGKVDRQALARLDVPPDSHETDAPPRDDDERLVAAAFERLLKLAPIGRDDDFFMLGGDSLLGADLQAQLLDASGVRVANLHVDATVVGIAREIANRRASRAADRVAMPVLFPLWPHGSEVPLFLVHGRHGQAFVSPHFMRLLGNEQPVWAFQARGLDGLAAPHASVRDMAAQYVAEMRMQRPRGPYFLAALCVGAYVAVLMAEMLRDDGETVLPLLLLDPPDRPQRPRFAGIGEQQFIVEMKERNAMGRNTGPVDDPAYVAQLTYVADKFHQALARHDPRPYDGAALVLVSRQRGGAQSSGLWRLLSGPVERFEVADTHKQALDPRNPEFARALLHCLRRVRSAASAPGAWRETA